jgi:hypothetical protein
MKTKNVLLVLIPSLLMSCSPMSEISEDHKAGFNGSFEKTKKGLPVNWQVYTTKTTGSGDFVIKTDTSEYVEGKQSLKFEIKSCSSLGGRFSPGIAQEIKITPGSYTVSCYLKSSGAVFRINAGGITTTGGDIKQLLYQTEPISEWKKFEFPLEVSSQYNTMRIELNVLSAGVLHIDDIRVEQVTPTHDL